MLLLNLQVFHENGSYGYLLGADDDEQLEVLRGLEADLYVIDECQSFPVERLEKLVTKTIEPQRGSRQGKILMIGTPGYLAAGRFWQATCPDAVDKAGRKYLVYYGTADADGRDLRKSRLWSFHHWTLQDNSALPHQWEEALITKAQNEWPDDHPTWLAEYIGLWTLSATGLVYRYATASRHRPAQLDARPHRQEPHGPPRGRCPLAPHSRARHRLRGQHRPGGRGLQREVPAAPARLGPLPAAHAGGRRGRPDHPRPGHLRAARAHLRRRGQPRQDGGGEPDRQVRIPHRARREAREVRPHRAPQQRLQPRRGPSCSCHRYRRHS